MKQTQFSTDDYLQAIRRELSKRATTYPKIIEKKRKQGMCRDELQEIVETQQSQIFYLESIKMIIEMGFATVLSDVKGCLLELMRELKMRKSYYPRLIYFKRITQETADYEIHVWESLTKWFAKEYLDLDELPTKRRKNPLARGFAS